MERRSVLTGWAFLFCQKPGDDPATSKPKGNRKAKEEMKKYQTAKYNIEQFLKKEEQEKQKTEEQSICV